MLASDDRPAVWQHTCAPMPVIMTFSERLRLRKSIWWGSPGGWRNRSTWHRPVHRWLDRVRLRDRSWPLERWCCCDQWQRCLNNKWNAREFAALHGVALPELYWSGRRVDDLPINDLPDNYVIRPAWGAGGLETFVMAGGVELLSLQRMSRSEVIERLRKKVGSVARFPILAEQFLANEQGHYERGVEYTFYVFGDRVGLVQQILRTGQQGMRTTYHPDWTVFKDARGEEDAFNAKRAGPLSRPRPASLDEMLDIARTLGSAYATFVRVDLYATAQGCYFGEFSSIPFDGKGYTPAADSFLGRLWEETFPDRI